MKTQSFTQESVLLEGLKDGSPQAVEFWFKHYHPKVLALVSTKVSVEKDAEEITQEIFLNCLKHLPLFRGESSIVTWMYSIARHEIADYYRKRYAKKAISLLPLNEILHIEDVKDAHEVSEKVRQVFYQMTQEHRELLLLKYIDQKKVRDIAQELGKSDKSVESELFRARIEFKRLYSLAE